MDLKDIQLLSSNKKISNGLICYDVFLVDGKEIRQISTEEKYATLSSKGAEAPKKDSAVWLYSYKTIKANTPDGDLKIGEFIDLGDVIIINETGKIDAIPKELIKNTEIIKDSQVEIVSK